MYMEWYTLYADMSEQTHLLIAGKTGSGKSVVVNGIIHSLLRFGTDKVNFVFIDPKKVELFKYAELPHTIYYADEMMSIRHALQGTVSIMENRFLEMRKHGATMYDGADIYVIIDEAADLMTTDKKYCKPLLQRIAQLGRAARVHLILCTQRPTNNIIPIDITCNIDSRVALKCAKAQDSRNIIGVSGAEELPQYGKLLYSTPKTNGIERWNAPYQDPAATDALVADWIYKASINPENQPKKKTHRFLWWKWEK